MLNRREQIGGLCRLLHDLQQAQGFLEEAIRILCEAGSDDAVQEEIRKIENRLYSAKKHLEAANG